MASIEKLIELIQKDTRNRKELFSGIKKYKQKINSEIKTNGPILDNKKNNRKK